MSYDFFHKNLVNDLNTFFVTLTVPLTFEGDLVKTFVDFVKFLEFSKNIMVGDLSYIAVFTHEGNGVVHVLFKGAYLSKLDVENQWSKFGGGFASCSKVDNKESVAVYMVTQPDIYHIEVYGDWLYD